MVISSKIENAVEDIGLLSTKLLLKTQVAKAETLGSSLPTGVNFEFCGPPLLKKGGAPYH